MQVLRSLLIIIHFDSSQAPSVLHSIESSSQDSLPVTPSTQTQEPAEQLELGPSRKKKKTSTDPIEEALLQHLHEEAEERRRRVVVEDTDGDHFGRHVSAVLKRLPGHARAMARLRIEQVLLDAEFPEPVPYM